jgi:hypothetical protein
LGKNQEETEFLAQEFQVFSNHQPLSPDSSKVILKVVDSPLVQKNLLLNFISAYLRPTGKKRSWMQRLLFWKFKQEKKEKEKEMSWNFIKSIKRSL